MRISNPGAQAGTFPGAGFSALVLALLLIAWTGPSIARDKTDVVYLRNGDRVTCEIKNLERGRLQVSTDSMSTVYIEWKDILRISSKELYIVELQDGSRLEGTLAETDAEGQLLLHDKDTDTGKEQVVAMTAVVWLDPLKLDSLRIKRWDGSVSAGFDTTKANNDTSLSASFDARRRAEDFQLNFNGSIYSRSQDGTEDSLRANVGGIYRGLLEDRWYWAGLGSLERNDELGIDLRTLGGAGYGRFLVQTGRALWSATAGLALVNEQRAGDEDAETNVEAFLSTDFEFFTYDTPKTTLNTYLIVFPSITDSGRVRANLDFSLRRELITDLFIELSVYDSYDSKPPEDGEKNDYGIVTGLGYTF
jgi:putative salt-induced outer membrane protein YdiY